MDDGSGSATRAIAIGLLATLGVLVVAIVLVMFNPFGSPGTDSPTASPTLIAGATSSPASPAPTTTDGDPSPTGDSTPSPGATDAPATTDTPAATATTDPATTDAPPTASPAAPTTAPASPGPTATAAPQVGWIEVTDFPTYRGFTNVASITSGGPGFVAVGSGGRTPHGRVWTSPDGVNWTVQPDNAFVTYSLDLVTRSGDMLYAFGRGHEGLRVWRSTDARNWVSLDESPALEWAFINDVAVVAGTMVAVGYVDNPEGEFGGAVWRSTDGVQWQRAAASGGLDEFWQVAARGSTLVATGRWPHLSGPMAVYSTDLGESWQAAQTDIEFGADAAAAGGLVTLAANGDRFVAVGYRELDDYVPFAMTSTDGTSWTSVTLEGTGAFALMEQLVALRGGRFVAIGTEGPTTGTARVSLDGRTWTDVPPLYTNQGPPRPPEGGDEVVNRRGVAASRQGVVVIQEWGDHVRVWFGPSALFD